jgi:hypothetical protein
MMMTMKLPKTLKFPILILVIWMCSSIVYAQSDITSVDDEFKTELALGPCKNDARLAAVKNLFLKNGAAESDIVVEKFKDVQNVIVVRKGKTDDTVVIGAHYDKVSAGCGIIDNWSGIVILTRLYKAFKNKDPQKT